MRKIKYLIIFCFLSFNIASMSLFADTESKDKSLNNFGKAVNFYNNRAEGAQGIKANSSNIDKAIELFTKSLDNKELELESIIYLIKSYYYKGAYVHSRNEDKKKIFNQGKVFAEEYFDKYPNSVAIRYWYLVNLGKWSEAYGKIAAAREGVADTMKDESERIIQMDPEYSDGGGYFMLGAVHYKSPWIPFLLTWPDNNEAVKFLKLAVNTGEARLVQKNYLANALNKSGNTLEAKKILEEVANSIPSEDSLIEDRKEILDAQESLNAF